MSSKILDFSNLKGDFTGGLVAGVVALPLALAFGVQSGMGATAGLYGAIMVGIFAALFGGTETQASGPTGPMTVVSAALVAAAIQLTGSLEAAMGIYSFEFLSWGCFPDRFRIGQHCRLCEVLPLSRGVWIYERCRFDHCHPSGISIRWAGFRKINL